MKNKYLIIIPLLGIALTGCRFTTNKIDSESLSSEESISTESSSEIPYDGKFHFEQIPYILKSGVSRDELQGAPWINANLPGMVAKIEKPSLKDDFYTAVNYDDLSVNNGGFFDQSDAVVRQQFNNMYDVNSGLGNSALFSRTKDLLKDGSIEAVHNYLTNININTYLHSKQLFSSLHSLFQLEKNGNKYYVSFVDGYINGETNIGTMSLGDNKMTAAKSQIMDKLYSVFDLSINSTQKQEVLDFDLQTGYTAYSSYADHGGNKWKQFSFNDTKTSLLDDALADYGLTDSDSIYISTPTIDVLALFPDYNDYEIKNSLITRLAFQYRTLTGVSNYRSISALLDEDWFPYDQNLSKYNDEEAVFRMVKIMLPYLVESAYLKCAADANIKARVAEIIEQIIDGYKKTAETYEWLDATTKEGLMNKLNYMEYESCYSDKILNYPLVDESNLNSLSLMDIYDRYNSWYQNLMDTGALETNPIFYLLPAYTVNAFYMPTMNTFVILNGILSNIPFDGGIEEVLGTIGVIIGHEISHSIDSTGSQFDESGNYHNWWTMNCREEFDSRITRMKRFYKQIELMDGVKVNGDKVNGEATADMGGVHIALEIAKTINDFDYDLFFKTFAKMWLIKAVTEDRLQERIVNEHPFNYLRVNVTLAQFDEFNETYDIGPGDRMYIPEDQRVAIW